MKSDGVGSGISTWGIDLSVGISPHNIVRSRETRGVVEPGYGFVCGRDHRFSWLRFVLAEASVRRHLFGNVVRLKIDRLEGP